MNKPCWKCSLVDWLAKRANLTNKNYWHLTNLFVWMHGGKDYCEVE